MQISDKNNKYLNLLKSDFNKEKFCEFIKDLLNLKNENITNENEHSAGTEMYKEYIDKVQLYAKYTDSSNNNIGFIILKLKDNKNPANARTLQRNYIAHLLDYYGLDCALSVIYSDTEENWRLSFVKQEIKIEVGGKVKAQLTPAKRYSYLFGKNEPNHTASIQLLGLLEDNDKQHTMEEIEEKFSVEKVTKDFFENYKENYLKLKETFDSNEEFKSEALRCDFTSEEFAKKLMGQIVFIYFLQKKGWLGVKLVPHSLSIDDYNIIFNKCDVIQKKILERFFITFNGIKKIKKELLENPKENIQEIECLSDIFVNTKFDCDWGTGEKNFIRAIFTNCYNRRKNFFDDYLEPFFYNGLNHRRKNQYFSNFNCKIPFLNGGLFEPLDNYQWEIASFNIENTIFSNEDGTGILDFFDRYNFTINEEEPLEKDVAVDPEMLGKIFENLLDVNDRAENGSFYTPREIVHYMCQESLANYLVNKVGVDYKEIKEFIQYGEMIRDVDMKEATQKHYVVGDSIFYNIGKIDKALEDIKVADPAVGSGAFPLGMLNEIVKLRDILTSYFWIKNKLGFNGKIYEKEKIFNKSRSLYNIKFNTIRNSIYAVDIENSAVDITKLRLWLSIVVDQVEVGKGGPEPLPNLDCKIMQGNSLIDEYKGIKLIEPKFIEELKDRDNIKFNTQSEYRIDFKGRRHKIYVDGDQIQLGDGQKKVQIDDFIRLKQELFETTNPQRKQEILNKIKVARDEILKLNFANTIVENEFFKVDSSHKKPYFSWMLEYIEVFIENDGFDIVIGNPPYVEARNSKFKKEDKDLLQKLMINRYGKDNYITRGSDLLIYFFELSNRILRNKGINSFITENAWLDTEYGIKFQKFLMKTMNIIGILDSKYKYFDSADINTIITFFEKIEKPTYPIKYFKNYKKTFENCNLLTGEKTEDIEIKEFDLKDNILQELKWGFLFNVDDNIFRIINKLYEKEDIYHKNLYSIGQGLNITKDYILNKKDISLIEKDSLIPFYTINENGKLIWDSSENYIVDSEKNKYKFENIKEFDLKRTTKVPAKIIIPRGIGSRHFASMNNIRGYSSSYVEIYCIDNNEIINNLWTFCNSSLFWLIREISGRTNLGGGMLKAEAVDLKNIPILFDFKKSVEIKNLIKESKDIIVEDARDEILKPYHKEIDKIVFDFLGLDNKERNLIILELINKIKSRMKTNFKKG